MLNNVHTLAFRAMGCGIQMWVQTPDTAAAKAALAEARRIVAAAEARFSRFRPESELSRLNARPGEWVPVSADLWRLIQRAETLGDATGGLFDIAQLAALEQAGYTDSFETLSGRRAAVATSPRTAAPPARFALDARRRAVRLMPGVRLDLGGIAKGDTAQQAVGRLRQVGPCLVDAGGDLCAGAAPVGQPGWPVAVAAPSGTAAGGHDLLRLWLVNAALATSGVDVRRWRQGDRAQHHIIDPRTGRPATSDLLGATVLSAEATTAEVWATAALVASAAPDHGRHAALARLEVRHIAAALVDADGDLWLTSALRRVAQRQV